MDSVRIKGYVLTYLSWSVAILCAAILSYLLTYALFKDAFPSVAEFSRYQEGALGNAIVASLGAIAVFIAAFEVILIIGTILALQAALKSYPLYRKATTAWLSLLSLLAPVVLVIDSMFGLGYLLIGGWLLLAPFLSRLLATRNR